MQQRFHLPNLVWLRSCRAGALILALLLAPLVLPAQAWAQDDVGQPTAPAEPVELSSDVAVGQTVKLTALKDTFISSGQPDVNFSGLSNLDVGWYANFNAVRPLIKFNLDSIPRNSKISGAQLVMYLDFALPANDGSMQLNAAPATQSWSESTADWNNAAGIGGSQFQLGTVGSQPGWASFDLTNQVQQWVNGQSNSGLIIIGDETPSLGRARIFRSREYGGSAPYLLVNYECDTLAPVTTMNPLPTYSTGAFTSSWSGSDRAPSGCKPSGIRKWHVEYRINGGAWVDWKSTTDTSYLFNNFAPNGSFVDFREYADDNAGNIEPKPNGPQTTTTIVSQAPAVTFNPLPTFTYTANFTVNWSAGATPVGVAGYDVQYQVNGGPWLELLSGSPLISYTITNAQSEQAFGFRARARDTLGNAGQFPPGAQVQTTVVLYPIAKMTPFTPNIITSTSLVTTSFTLNWTGSTPPGTTINSYEIYYRVFDFQGTQVQPWTLWQTFGGTVNSAPFPIDLGNGIYAFEAAATNTQGQTTPVTGIPEATMLVDRDDTIQPKTYMSYISSQ